jgi:hypothetical protein
MVILASIGFGQNWEVEGITTGGACAIAADSACLPHIAFGCPAGLGYASRTQDSWNIGYPRTGIVVSEVELCLDGNELPHIGYKAGPYDPPYTDSVCYAYNDGDTWHVEVVVRNATLFSLVLARDGTPHMAFLDSSQVKYAHKADDTWSILTVPAYQADSLRQLGGASLALDTSDRPGVAVAWHKYYGGHHDSLWLSVFEYDGTSWHRFDVDSAQARGSIVHDFWRCRVRSDPGTDLFHVVYRDATYATGEGSKWQIESANVSVGNRSCDFALHQGRPHVACASTFDPVMHQWRGAGGWEEERVVNTGLLADPSIAVDRTGRPHIAFVPFADGTLYYARRLFVGTEEPAPTTIHPKPRLLVHPNPATRAFTLEFTIPRRTTTAITLIDASGRIVWSQKENIGSGCCSRSISLPASIGPGVYFCTLDEGGERISRKVVLTD